jgi:peptidoglycan hydrolase-like protein with peptidoglycan-binding domain
MLKLTETGKLSDADREAIKTYQSANGLKETGTLNRATLEKMNVELTSKQKSIPVNPNSYASADEKGTKEKKPRKPVFRANKDQIVLAQRMLKEKGFYMGDETGKLDPATRDSIKKFQESVTMKETGTLNRATLEAMKIELTDKQRAM